MIDGQVDLILRSLEFYLHAYEFIYPRSNKNISEEENLRIGLVRLTYNQIYREYEKSKKENPIQYNSKK